MSWWQLLAVLTVFTERAYGAVEIGTHTYLGGCVLLRTKNTIRGHVGHDMRSPFLNCSHLSQSIFGMGEFPLDIASMNFASNEITVFSMADIQGFTKLKELDLRSNQISEFERSDLFINSIEDAHLSNNNINHLPKKFFCSAPKVVNLFLSANEITKIHDHDFDCLNNLRVLTLSSNPLSEISDKAFKHLSSTLLTLFLSSTGLREVPDFLSKLLELRYLSLANNKIASIPASAFSALRKLQWLELSSNKIAKIDSMAFTGPTSLRYLDLTNNLLETLEVDVFDFAAEDLRLSIEMYENPLRCDCSIRWLKLWTDGLVYKDVRYKCEQPLRVHGKKSYELTYSDFVCDEDEGDWSEVCTTTVPITVNFLTPSTVKSQPDNTCPKRCSCFDATGKKYYPEGSKTFSPRKRFTGHWNRGESLFPQVDCSTASLTKLPTDTRKDVKALIMRENLLETFDIADLAPYSSMRELDLQGCGLKSIKSSPTTILPKLAILFLQCNELTTLSRTHLGSFPNLRVLNLFHNKFVKFPEKMFSYNSYLDHLYLGSNPVRYFDPRTLHRLNLHELSLRNLSLDHVPVLHLKNLTYLDLSHNAITAITDHTFVSMPNLHHLAMDCNEISVIQPGAFDGAFNLRELDLSENEITTLPNGVFKDLSDDWLHIKLWINKLFCDCELRWLKTWIQGLQSTNSVTNIHFLCLLPQRMHHLDSDQLVPSDFVCKPGDKRDKDLPYTEEDYHTKDCFTAAHMVSAVFITLAAMMLLCLLIYGIYRCCKRWKKQGSIVGIPFPSWMRTFYKSVSQEEDPGTSSQSPARASQDSAQRRASQDSAQRSSVPTADPGTSCRSPVRDPEDLAQRISVSTTGSRTSLPLISPSRASQDSAQRSLVPTAGPRTTGHSPVRASKNPAQSPTAGPRSTKF